MIVAVAMLRAAPGWGAENVALECSDTRYEISGADGSLIGGWM